MAEASFTAEIPMKVSADRLFKAGCIDVHNVAPKALPQYIIKGTLETGNGDVGSVKFFEFVDGLAYKFVKERLDVLDKENYECVNTIIEGGGLGTTIESGKYHHKLDPNPDGGCTFKTKGEFVVKPGVDPEAYANVEKEMGLGFYKTLEQFLIENPEI